MKLAHKVAQAIVRVRALRSAVVDSGRISFQRVSGAELDEVGTFRIRYYRESASSYLIENLDSRGLDDLDARSLVYAARSDGQIVATLRATPAPFELDRHVPRARLQAAIGLDLERYVEVSRMLADPRFAGRGIASAMASFAGVDVMLNTRYRGYLAYIRLAGEPPAARLAGASTVLKFQIPSRGTHEYAVVAGAISVDALWRGVRRVRDISGRRAARGQEHS